MEKIIKGTMFNTSDKKLNISDVMCSSSKKNNFVENTIKKAKDGLKLEDWDKLKEDDILVLNHDNGSFKCGDKFRFQWSDGISIVVKPDGDESSRGSNNIYLDRASILFFHTIEQWEN
jgi:hypothetical protein